MTAEEAAQTAKKTINPKITIPMHYGTGIAGTEADAEKFRDLLIEEKINVAILE